MLQTITLSFIALKCSPVIRSRQPEAVTTISASLTASIIFLTSKPSIAACNAQIGSISVTITRQPAPANEAAEPLPTSPYPPTTAILPANITSVARRIESTNDSLQPYLLSNLDLVTESFTLIAGIGNVPFATLSYRRCTPVVVSSEIPFTCCTSSGYLSNTILVRSPPSSNIIFNGLSALPKNNVCSIHQSASSNVSPFHANTPIPAAAIAAAAWSCVENILQELHLTSAPNSISVSIKTAVWIVMCKQPAILAPCSGFVFPYSSLRAISPGISASANFISLRPHSARLISATLWARLKSI